MPVPDSTTSADALKISLRGTALAWPLAIFASLLLVNAQELFHAFAFHNDYRSFELLPDGCCFQHPEATHLIGIGRPLGAYLLGIQTHLLLSMQAYWVNRLLAILIIAGCAWSVFAYLTRNFQLRTVEAFALSAGIFLLPAMEINTFWAANLAPGVLAVAIAIGAFFLFRARSYRWAVLAALAALLIYPPNFLFFLVLSLLDAVLPRRAGFPARRQVLTDVGFIAGMCLAYFVFVLFVLKAYLIHADPLRFGTYFAEIGRDRPEYSLNPSFGALRKLHQLVEMGRMATALWFNPLQGAWFVLALAALAGAGYRLWRLRGAGGFGVLAIVLVLVLSPVLTAPGAFDVPYRTIFPITASVCVLYFSLYWHAAGPLSRRLIGLLFATACAAGVVSTLYRLDTVVWTASHEFATVRTQVALQITDQTQVIHWQTLPAGMPYDGRPLYKDYRLLAGGASRPMPGLVRAVLADMGLDHRGYRVEIHDRPEYPMPAPAADRIFVTMAGDVAPPSGPVDFAACDILMATSCVDAVEGLGGLEQNADKTVFWRWGVGPATTVRFKLHSHQILHLRLDAANPLDRPTRLHFSLNGQAIRSMQLAPRERIDLELPLQAQLGANELQVEYSDWNHHADTVINANDIRKLAVNYRAFLLH